MLYNKSNHEILMELDKRVYGHTAAKKALINLVARSRVRHFQKWVEMIHEDYLVTPHKLLLLGPSGTGKTHMIESLQEIVPFPLIRLDATKLNPTGAGGGVKEEGVRKMIVDHAKRLVAEDPLKYYSVDGAIDQMVVFVDEVDKLGNSFDSSGNWNSHTQANFLTLFDHKKEFSGVSYIFAGAFTSITNEKPKTKNNIGFSRQKDEVDEFVEMDTKIVGAGLLPELVGRITSIEQLDNFTVEDYYNILVDRLLPKKMRELAFFGIFENDIEEDILHKMADSAKKSHQGIRALQRQLDKHFASLEFDHEYKMNKPPRLDGIIEETE